jgi:O-antigen/teichoic acid export membrane protein
MYPQYERLTRFLGKHLRADVGYIAHGGFFLTLTQITSAIIGLLITIAFSNLLPVETYGTYKYIIALYSLLAIGALPGIETSLVQSVSRGYDAMLRVSMGVRARWGLLGTLAGILYAGYLFHQGSIILGILVVIAGAAVPLLEPATLYISFLNGKKRFKEWSAIDIGIQMFSITCLIGAMLLTKNIIALVLAYFVPLIIASAAATWYAERTYAQKSAQDPDFIQYGRSMTLFQIIGTLMGSIDQIVLYHFLGPAQVAIFALAMAVPNRMQSVFRTSGILAFPRYTERPPEEVTRSLPRKMILFSVGIIVLACAYVTFAPILFTYVFPKYLPSITYSQVLVFYTLSAITYPFGAYLNAHKKVRDNYILAISGFSAKVLALIAFVPIWGIWGAVIGVLANSVTTIVLSLWMILRSKRTVVAIR